MHTRAHNIWLITLTFFSTPLLAGKDVIFASSFEPICSLIVSPGDSFDNAFNQMQAGDTLCLNDGVYNQAMEVPSQMHVRAVNDGMAELDGQDTLGPAWQGGLLNLRGDDSSARGLKVYHSGPFVHACRIAGNNNHFKLMSCSHGGSYKHSIPMLVSGAGHLIEDSWFYGEGRYVVQCYLGDHNTFRRNVARWDETTPNEPNEPNATFSNYNCSDNTWENNISLDYGEPETPMPYGGDFYSPNHDDVYPELNHDNHWYGNIVINHDANTSNNRAFRADNNHGTFIPGGIVKDFYVRDVGTDFVIKSNYEFTISDCTMVGVSNVNRPCNDPADVSKRYINGIKTNQNLWPFPHQDLIKRDFCAPSERQSYWCLTDKDLTDYVIID